MVEDVFLQDLKSRGVEVLRDRSFIAYTMTDKTIVNANISVRCDNSRTGKSELFNSNYLVGCDGAHSKVRKSMAGVEMEGEPGRAAWGVLDG
jgi:phenol 2-monooxygenase